MHMLTLWSEGRRNQNLGEIPQLAKVQNYGFLFCCTFKHEPIIGLFTVFVVLQRE